MYNKDGFIKERETLDNLLDYYKNMGYKVIFNTEKRNYGNFRK